MALAIAALTLALVVAALPLRIGAAEQRYLLRAGESLESIAADVYGNAELADWLAAFNRLSAPPRAGDELRLPGAERHAVAAGDTWDALAERALGSANLGDELARLNGRAPDAPLEPGDDVRLPAVTPYRIVAGDSLARISRRFYASPELAPLLARMNALANAGHVLVGRTIRVPIPHVVQLKGLESDPAASEPQPADPAEEQNEEAYAASSVEPEPTAPTAPAAVESPPSDAAPVRLEATPAPRGPTKPLVAPPRSVPRAAPAPVAERAVVALPVNVPPVSAAPPAQPSAPEFAEALRAASNAYLDGRYDAALASLEQLRSEVLARAAVAEQHTLLRQLAFVYVAYDRSTDACTAWRALRKLDGDTRLDPSDVSPKIRRVVSGC